MIYTTLIIAYPKEHVFFIRLVNILYNIIVLESFMSFYMIYDHVIVTVIYSITFIFYFLFFKNIINLLHRA